MWYQKRGVFFGNWKDSSVNSGSGWLPFESRRFDHFETEYKSDLRDIEWKFDGIEIGCKGAVQSYAIEGKLLELSGSTGGAAAWENN